MCYHIYSGSIYKCVFAFMLKMMFLILTGKKRNLFAKQCGLVLTPFTCACNVLLLQMVPTCGLGSESWVQHVACRTKLIVGMGRWFNGWVPATLPEDLSLVPSIHIRVAYTTTYNSSSRGSDTFFWRQRALVSRVYTHKHTHTQFTHTNIHTHN